MRREISVILAVVLAATCGVTCFAPAAEAAVIYVDASAGGSGSGRSWTNAHTDLQAALEAASSGDEIWVSTGTYSPGSAPEDTFEMKNCVRIYGGFAGTETRRSQRDPAVSITVLSGGNNNYHVVTADTGVGNSALLDGLTVTGGKLGNGERGVP